MKRFLLIALGLLALGAGVLYALSDRLAEAAARSAIRRVVALAAVRGVELRDVSFATARFTAIDTIVCDRVRGGARLGQGLLAAGPEQLAGAVDRVLVEVAGFWNGRVRVSFFGGVVDVLDGNGQPKGERISQVMAQLETDVSWRHPAQSAARVEEEVRRLFREGRCKLVARIEGAVRFRIGTRWEEVVVRSRSEHGETALVLDDGDLRRVSRDYVERLTPTEIQLVAENPVRAPALLRLSEQASAAAAAQRRRDHAFPQDAFRHVYWSYLLTRAFGADFAERVTDAHEVEPTYEPGEANVRMDLSNNAVGRSYALADVPEGELPDRVRRDPRVVRAPR